MKILDKVVVVTGAAEGIGRALARAFSAQGAKRVIVADRNFEQAQKTAKEIDGLAIACDVSNETDIQNLVAQTQTCAGPIDLFCSNAGVGDFGGHEANVASAPNEQWMRGWEVNVMAHVYAARACLPGMIARESGYFLNTASAAGLLNQIGGAVYGVTKHAAVGFAEILAITHRHQGIRVSVLCPQAVDTAMLASGQRGAHHVDGVLSPEEVALCALEGIDKETFVILPHPQVLNYMRKKTENYDRWIAGMAKFRKALSPE